MLDNSKDQFFEFGLSETIYAPLDKAEVAWQELKHRIQNNQQVFIRGFGRNSNGTHLFQAFYADVLSNNQVTVDPTNNAQPTKLIRDLTGYSIGMYTIFQGAVKANTFLVLPKICEI
jgi:hypothetical protein